MERKKFFLHKCVVISKKLLPLQLVIDLLFYFFNSCFMTIYVGNIAYTMTEEGLRSAFGEHGNVVSAKIIVDRATNRSKGYGFVEMEVDAEGNAAIEALNDREIGGRRLRVNAARPRE
ncbi:MAG: RNA-binding protein [Prevotellaceae bacterium]|nr:RNA-binding protein [Prevotellaceae bacterium]